MATKKIQSKKLFKSYSTIEYIPTLHRIEDDPYTEWDRQPHDRYPVVNYNLHPSAEERSDERRLLKDVRKLSDDVGYHYYNQKGERVTGDAFLKHKSYQVRVPRSSLVSSLSKAYETAEKRIAHRKDFYDDFNYGNLFDYWRNVENSKEVYKLASKTHARRRRSGKSSLRLRR